MHSTLAPLVLTVKFDQANFAYLNNLRQRYFPAERNFIPAHLTLFHALPGAEELRIKATLQAICNTTSILSLALPDLFSLGRGVAVTVLSPQIISIKRTLQATWIEMLTPQDQQRHKPHITLQNKVSAQVARAALAELSAQWQPRMATGIGLLLWHYRGGPWELNAEFLFKHP